MVPWLNLNAGSTINILLEFVEGKDRIVSNWRAFLEVAKIRNIHLLKATNLIFKVFEQSSIFRYPEDIVKESCFGRRSVVDSGTDISN